MVVSRESEVDSAAARRIWEDYQRQHDRTDEQAQSAGIDPVSARIWFGESVAEIIAKRDAEGSRAPLYFVRVGSPIYYRNATAR